MIKWLKCQLQKWHEYRWFWGVGWVRKTSHGILPSKYKTPEKIKAFKKEVEEVTRAVENQSSDSFPGIRL